MNTAEAVRNDKRVPVLYLDLDGTVRKGKDELGRFVNSAADVELFPRMAERLLSYKQQGWRIVGVSNQGGIATGMCSLEDVQGAIVRTQELAQGLFDLIYICQHHPDAHDPEWRNCFCRKPKIGMLVMACIELGNRHHGELYPPHIALMVGDREEDRQCAEAAGVAFRWAKDWRQEPFTIHVQELTAAARPDTNIEPHLTTNKENEMHPYQQRVVEEKQALTEKLDKLEAFEGGPIYATLPPDEQARLTRQLLIMKLYEQVLSERIANFTA